MGFLKALFLRRHEQYCDGLYLWSDDTDTYIAPTRWSHMVKAREFFDATYKLKIPKADNFNTIAVYRRIASGNKV